LNEENDEEFMKGQRMNLQTLTQIEMTRKVRDHIQDNIQTLLDNSLGEGNAFVRVSVELDFDARSVDKQTFTPVVDESGIIRSQQDISESYNGESNTPGGPAGIQGNIPGYVAEDRNSNAAYERKESTKNYEVNEENQKVISSPGSIRRLTVAVLVNDTVTALQQESLLRVVSSAAGINEDRGDTISVEPLPFNTEKRDKKAAEEAAEQERKDRILYMEIGALILLLALIAGGVFMNRRKKQQEREALEEARRIEEERQRAEEEEQRRIEEEERAVAIEADRLPEDSLTEEERQQRDEKKAILKLIDEKPADMAMLIKQWLSEDE
jgi:flagellar M-ring protein FliF